MRDAEFVRIGPPTEWIAAVLRCTTAARTLAAGVQHDVPVVPGTTKASKNVKEAAEIAKKFGYPVLLKAAAVWW